VFAVRMKSQRSTSLINLEYVTSIEPWDSARLQVVMKSGVQIAASRTGSKRLRELAL
jgi:DNA-binding LytR/AlgR family response regulator